MDPQGTTKLTVQLAQLDDTSFNCFVQLENARRPLSHSEIAVDKIVNVPPELSGRIPAQRDREAFKQFTRPRGPAFRRFLVNARRGIRRR